MCLAVPLKIKNINGMDAVCERDGVIRKVRLDLLKDPKEGEYVLVHAGYAIEKINEQQAKENIEAYKEIVEEINKLYSKI